MIIKITSNRMTKLILDQLILKTCLMMVLLMNNSLGYKIKITNLFKVYKVIFQMLVAQERNGDQVIKRVKEIRTSRKRKQITTSWTFARHPLETRQNKHSLTSLMKSMPTNWVINNMISSTWPSMKENNKHPRKWNIQETSHQEAATPTEMPMTKLVTQF